MLNLFKRKKRKLSSHEKAIAIMYLHIKKNELQKDINSTPNEDRWGIKHDIECISNTILYLEGNLYERK